MEEQLYIIGMGMSNGVFFISRPFRLWPQYHAQNHPIEATVSFFSTFFPKTSQRTQYCCYLKVWEALYSMLNPNTLSKKAVEKTKMRGSSPTRISPIFLIKQCEFPSSSSLKNRTRDEQRSSPTFARRSFPQSCRQSPTFPREAFRLN